MGPSAAQRTTARQCAGEEGSRDRGHDIPDADAVSCGRKGQKTPDGYYNLERMLKRFATGAHRLLLCGTCMDARGLTESDLIEGSRRSSMDELAEATVAADKVLVF